jgi:rhamnosyl/mannosyltransferase
LRNLARGLKRLGVDQRVVVCNVDNKTVVEEVDGIDVIRMARLGEIFSTPICLGWGKNFNHKKYDIIHLHHPNPIATFYLSKSKLKSKLVVGYHSDIVRQRYLKNAYHPILRRVLERADVITTAGPEIDFYDKILRDFSEKCVTIPYGVDLGQWETTPKAVEGAKEIASAYKRPIILFVGRLVYYKGVEFLIKAMTGLYATLLIVGAGPEERRLKKLVDRLNLNSKITFVGFVPNEDLPSYYRACDVFCLPSVVRSESFGIVQLEAMASSRPVVSTEIGTATSFVNRDGETGIIVPPRDEKALTSALKAILDDPILKRRLGEDARRRVVKYFDYRVIAGKFLDLYNKII